MFIRSMYVCMYIIGYNLVDEDLELLYIAGEGAMWFNCYGKQLCRIYASKHSAEN